MRFNLVIGDGSVIVGMADRERVFLVIRVFILKMLLRLLLQINEVNV